jgi:hypothetical protein
VAGKKSTHNQVFKLQKVPLSSCNVAFTAHLLEIIGTGMGINHFGFKMETNLLQKHSKVFLVFAFKQIFRLQRVPQYFCNVLFTPYLLEIKDSKMGSNHLP